MAATEIKGSRPEREDGRFKYGMMLFATTDAAHGLTVGASMFTPAGGSAESGVTGRRLVGVTVDVDTVPGIYLHVAKYAGPKAYA